MSFKVWRKLIEHRGRNVVIGDTVAIPWNSRLRLGEDSNKIYSPDFSDCRLVGASLCSCDEGTLMPISANSCCSAAVRALNSIVGGGFSVSVAL